MASILTGLEPEPGFPMSDISAENARMLSVMLSNPSVLRLFHESAESMIELFRIGHPAVRGAVEIIYDEEKARAASVGAAVYEAMSALVQYNPRQSTVVSLATAGLLPASNRDELSDYLQSGVNTFCQVMPKTASVIEEATFPLIAPDTAYALLGAAATRKLELMTV